MRNNPIQNSDSTDSTAMTTATRELVTRFFQTLTTGDPDRIAALFAEQIDWNIPGNTALAPWLGRRSRREEVAAFFRLLLESAELVRFDIQHLLVEDDFAVAVGEFASVMRKTGKLFESEFAIQFTVRDGVITRYRLLEEGWGLVVALTDDD